MKSVYGHFLCWHSCKVGEMPLAVRLFGSPPFVVYLLKFWKQPCENVPLASFDITQLKCHRSKHHYMCKCRLHSLCYFTRTTIWSVNIWSWLFSNCLYPIGVMLLGLDGWRDDWMGGRGSERKRVRKKGKMTNIVEKWGGNERHISCWEE